MQSVISSIFGNFNDKREIQAALHHHNDSINYFDCCNSENELWLDYVSDSGDGFDATFTIAKLLARPNLKINRKTLNRGDLLIMGGDQVYPSPSREEYNNRYKRVTHQITQLKEEIDAKEAELVKEHTEHNKKDKKIEDEEKKIEKFKKDIV